MRKTGFFDFPDADYLFSKDPTRLLPLRQFVVLAENVAVLLAKERFGFSSSISRAYLYWQNRA